MERFDLHLFGQQLGVQGRQALERLKRDPRYAGDARLIAEIDDALRDPYARPEKPRALAADDLRVLPAGTTLPAGLFESIAADLEPGAPSDAVESRPDCHPELRICVLMALDLGGPDGVEWLFVPSRTGFSPPPLVYGRTADGSWQLMAWVAESYNSIGAFTADALLDQAPSAAASRWWALRVGDRSFPIIDGRPASLDRRPAAPSAGP